MGTPEESLLGGFESGAGGVVGTDVDDRRVVLG